MKKRQDEEDEQRKRGEKKMKISPKKEPISPACSEQAATPKTGSVSTGMTKSRSISTPKSEPSKTSPTKPEVFILQVLLDSGSFYIRRYSKLQCKICYCVF